ncbi:MAG: Abi family protein [Planctomycetes bacterium]|nr:Abi family protein [Planctomycetota bacterium]
MKYGKPPLTFEQQIELLKSRGLIINNDSEAIEILENINYYRLSAYFLPFQSSKDKFNEGTTFVNILHLYEFDRKLQNLVLEALAGIEIAVRTQLAYQLAHKYGTFGYLDSNNFYHYFNHYNWLKKVQENVQRSHEVFVKHFRRKYTSETDLPIWMICEAIQFGQVSQLFQGLKKHDKQAIARGHFKIDQQVFTSWLHSIVYVRNLCAHHSRAWNRTLAIRPKKLHKSADWANVENDKIFSVFLIIKDLMFMRNQWDGWSGKLLTLLGDFPGVDVSRMGFPKNWRDILFDSTNSSTSSG